MRIKYILLITMLTVVFCGCTTRRTTCADCYDIYEPGTREMKNYGSFGYAWEGKTLDEFQAIIEDSISGGFVFQGTGQGSHEIEAEIYGYVEDTTRHDACIWVWYNYDTYLIDSVRGCIFPDDI